MGSTTRPELKGTFGVVSSTHWLAAQCGMSVLERGGNAFDAAVAAGFVLQVVEPHLNGLGGEVPIVLWDVTRKRVEVICGQGPAPAAADIDRIRDMGLGEVPGTGLVAACDIAVGTPEAKFCFSEAKLGLSPATISPYVMRAIGARAASRYFLSAEVFDAQEALRIGMLSALVPAAGLDASVEALVQHLLAGGSEAHARIKDLIRRVAGRPIDDELRGDTARRIAEIRASPEGKEGIAAFLEKRKPKWFSGKS